MKSSESVAVATGDLSRYCGPLAARAVDRVVVAGDWHGIAEWGRKVITTASAHGIGVILHAGDFGIWPGKGATYRDQMEKACRESGVVILVTPGNHEWWEAIDQLAPTDRGDGWGALKWVTDHIAVLPRGHRFTLTTGTEGGALPVSRTFVSMGGAPSIDYLWRREGVNWWPSEQITDADVATVVAGGTADVMLTHDAPDVPYATPSVSMVVASNPHGWPNRGLAYAAVGRRRVTRAFEGVAPAMLVHGHFHVADEAQVLFLEGHGPGRDGGCTVVSLDQQETVGNVRILDLATLTTHALPLRAW